MPDNPDAKKEENSRSSKNIQFPAIPKQTAGAVVGAAAGSIAGPIGAVVGGMVGAVAGKAAEKRRPIVPAARRKVRKVLKEPEPGRKHPANDPRPGNPLPNRAKLVRAPAMQTKRVSRPSTTTKSRKAARARGRRTSARAARKHSGGHRKRH